MYGSGDSAAVETTGLAVQALLQWGQASERRPQGPPLTSPAKRPRRATGAPRRRPSWRCKALLLASERGSADVRGTVQVLLNGHTVQTLQLTPDNNDLLHQFVLPDIDPHQPSDVQLRFSGTGGLAYQVAGRYFLPWDTQPGTRTRSPSTSPTTAPRSHRTIVATATATIRNNLRQDRQHGHGRSRHTARLRAAHRGPAGIARRKPPAPAPASSKSSASPPRRPSSTSTRSPRSRPSPSIPPPRKVSHPRQNLQLQSLRVLRPPGAAPSPAPSSWRCVDPPPGTPAASTSGPSASVTLWNCSSCCRATFSPQVRSSWHTRGVR